MADISGLKKLKTDLQKVQSNLTNYNNSLSSWQGTAKDDFVKLINELTNNNNAYSINKIIESLNSFITSYENANK